LVNSFFCGTSNS